MALIKQKYTRGNESPFMSKHIQKIRITRTRLRNKLLKEATPINRWTLAKIKSTSVFALAARWDFLKIIGLGYVTYDVY